MNQQNNFRRPSPTLLWALCLCTCSLGAQTFTDIPGPMGTTRCFLKGFNDTIYLGSSSKGVFRSLDQGQSWTGVGGNTIMTGRINALAIDSSKHLIAATEQGGVKQWNGSAWVNANTGLFTACGITIPIRCLAVTPDGSWYAGAHAYSACFPNGNLYQWVGGAWTSLTNGLSNQDINALAVHPTTGVLYAGTEGGVFQLNGTVWTALNTGLTDTTIHELVFAPNGDLFAGTNSGVSKLASNGSTWTQLSNGLNGTPVYAIAVDQDPTHLILGGGYNLEQVGSLYGQLYETKDGGNNWVPIAPNLESTVINDLSFIGTQTCLAAAWGILKSSDNGQNWAASNAGFSARTFNTQGRLAITPAPNHALFYGSDDGVFRSMDEGITWTMASQGISRHIVTLLKADHFGNLFCGVMRYLGENSVGFGDGMLYKSTDQGDHWTPVSISKDWRYMEISELPNGDLICAHGFGAQPPSASIIGSSLARSKDHGDTWTDLNVSSGMAFCCAANEAGDLFVAGESQSVYRSTDGGNSFELIVAPGQSGNVGTLEVSPTGAILMGSAGQRTFFFSSDNGSNYESFSSPVLPDYRGVSDVIFDDQGKAFCTTSGQGGAPALFTISPPFSANSTFTPVSGLAGSLFKMTWDECGHLYIYRGGGILKSMLPLRLPESDCISGTESPVTGQPEIQLYPNPATELIQLRTESEMPVMVELWNANGQKIKELSLYKAATLNLEALPGGCYWIYCRNESNCFKPLKFIKL